MRVALWTLDGRIGESIIADLAAPTRRVLYRRRVNLSLSGVHPPDEAVATMAGGRIRRHLDRTHRLARAWGAGRVVGLVTDPSLASLVARRDVGGRIGGELLIPTRRELTRLAYRGALGSLDRARPATVAVAHRLNGHVGLAAGTSHTPDLVVVLPMLHLGSPTGLPLACLRRTCRVMLDRLDAVPTAGMSVYVAGTDPPGFAAPSGPGVRQPPTGPDRVPDHRILRTVAAGFGSTVVRPVRAGIAEGLLADLGAPRRPVLGMRR